MLRRLPEGVGDDAEDHAERHAGELHQRQQEAGLHQRQAERVAQHRDRGRQLADVQGRDDAGEDHEQRRARRGARELWPWAASIARRMASRAARMAALAEHEAAR